MSEKKNLNADKGKKLEEEEKRKEKEKEKEKKKKKDEEKKNKEGDAEKKKKFEAEQKKKKKEDEETLLKIYSELKKRSKDKRSIDDAFKSLQKLVAGTNSDWIKSADDTTKEEILQRLEKDIGKSKDLISREDMSPTQVLENSSALRGIYFTKNIDDFVKQRQALLKSPSEVKFQGPLMKQIDKVEEFNSREQHDTFHQAIQTSGFGMAAEVTVASKVGVGVRVGASYESKEEHETWKQENTSGTFYSKLMCSVLPVALWKPNISEMALCDEVVDNLGAIGRLLAMDQADLAKDNVQNFFKHFGSHFYSGDVHFGGVYTIETTYSSDKKSNKSTTKKLVQSMHSAELDVSYNKFGVAKVGVSVSAHKESGEAENKGEYDECESSNVNSEHSKKGGPLEVSNVDIWKLGLLNNKSTWTIVDRGKMTLCDYVGVWDLIRTQSSAFSNPTKLSRFLFDTWQDLTGFEGSDAALVAAEQFAADDKLQSAIETISNRLNSDSSPETYLMSVKELQKEVKKVEKGIWLNQLKTNEKATSILLSAVNVQCSENHKLEICAIVKKLLQNTHDVQFLNKAEIKAGMVRRGDPDESVLNSVSFKTIDQFLRVLGDEFVGHLKILECQTDKTDQMKDISTFICIELATAVSRLLKVLHDGNKDSQYLLLLAMVIPLGYDVLNMCFRYKITINQIEIFVKTSKNDLSQHNIYSKNANHDCMKSQAWVLKLVTLNITTQRPREVPECHHVIYMQERFAEIIQHFRSIFEFDPTINELCTNDSHRIDFDVLLTSLESIMQNTQKSSKLITWEYFESLPPNRYQTLVTKPKSTSVEMCQNIAEPLACILQTFGLIDQFPGKICISKVLEIHENLFSKPKSKTDIPWAILRKIISINFSFRESVLQEYNLNASKTTVNEQTHLTEKEKKMNRLLGRKPKENKNHKVELHPSDVFLAIFHCCDPFLKRFIVQKMSVCQLAMPFLYNDFINESLILSLWPLREIFAEAEGFSSQSVASQPLKIVSFMRMGSERLRSKSKLINEFMRDQNAEHSTFFHKDCPLGSLSRTLSIGTIEASWFVPHLQSSARNDIDSGTEASKTKINEPLTILNLRGDAQKYQTQSQCLLQISNLIVLLVKFDNLLKGEYSNFVADLHKSEASVILVTDLPEDTDLLMQYIEDQGIDDEKTRFVEENSELNATELKSILTQHMSDLLETAVVVRSLDEISCSLPSGIRTDEEGICTKGKQMCETIFQQMLGSQSAKMKNNLLPLQGEHMWQQWSKHQKDQRRCGKLESYDTSEKLPNAMKDIRKQQIQSCNEAPDIMAKFVEMLILNIDDIQLCSYFLYWTRYTLDNRSRIVLPTLRKKFYDAFKTYESSRLAIDQKQLKGAEEILVHASLGLEHFFREMGQIYEAFHYCRDESKLETKVRTKTVLNHLPVIAAKLLLMGHPLEIMDGDAANVPLKWVKDVFKELQRLIGSDRKLFSISVLGIQSSGKSTLLNTMFGLQFAVSAGRCTRGMFIQLIPVDRSRSSLKFDYAVVIDTEGLRAPELAGEKIHHDNELATLVIGLGDIVILNIKGETIADMENVLQIVVHGLLRLKQANRKLELSQSCIIVHQNVSATDTDDQTLQGRQKTLENLDAMTRDIASQEHMSHINSFKQVIKFDPFKHDKNVGDLWHGCPPMAPSSQKYSENVAEIAQCILNIITVEKKERENKFLSISDSYLHLESLWNGILAEDFVFSFRNCLEVKAYSLLEAKYQELRWILEETRIEWWNKNVRCRLNACQTHSEIDETASNLVSEFNQHIIQKASETEQRIVEFIEKSPLSEQMINWKENKKRNLEAISSDLKFEVKSKIQQERERCKIGKKTQNIVEEKKQEINDKASSLAISLKGKAPTKEELRQKFDEMWINWFNEMAPHIRFENISAKDKMMINEMQMVLYDMFTQHHPLIRNGLVDCKGDLCLTRLKSSFKDSDIAKEDINSKRRFKDYLPFTEKSYKEHRREALKIVDQAFESIDKYFDILDNHDTEYEKSYFSKILKYVNNDFIEHNEKEDVAFTLTDVLQIKVVLHAYEYSRMKFRQMNKTYDEKHSVRTQLEKYKEKAWNLFGFTVKGKTNDIIAAYHLFDELEELIFERVRRDIPLQMQKKINKEFNHDKYHLMKAILTDLAKGKVFSDYVKYIKKPETYAFDWLLAYTKKKFFGKNEGGQDSMFIKWSKEKLTSLIEEVKNAASVVTNNNCPSNIKTWIKAFKAQIEGNHFMITDVSFQKTESSKVADFQNFLVCLTKNLSEYEAKAISDLEKDTEDSVKWEHENPYESIFESLWGCQEKCPLCNEPCRKGDSKHASSDNDCHECIQHRPSGINGTHWRESDKLAIESCNFDIQSTNTKHCGKWCGCTENKCDVYHPYQEYKKYMPRWDIAPSNDIPKYWKWFMAKFCHNLVSHYQRKSPDIPTSWNDLSELDAIDSLGEYFHM